MTRLTRVTSALLLSGTLAPLATAQTPPPRYNVQRPANPQVTAPRQAPATSTPSAAQAQSQARRRSIVHHYPYPYANYYYNDRTAGFRNPGGGGRYAEYYPPGDRFQNESGRDPVRVATFDRGGGPTLADQRAAQQIGIQRESVIYNHIDSYARPYGFGFGVGYFGGFN